MLENRGAITSIGSAVLCRPHLVSRRGLQHTSSPRTPCVYWRCFAYTGDHRSAMLSFGHGRSSPLSSRSIHLLQLVRVCFLCCPLYSSHWHQSPEVYQRLELIQRLALNASHCNSNFTVKTRMWTRSRLPVLLRASGTLSNITGCH
ncbi:hypothetical protein CSUI_006764 [Cystoisospora suis]|uniref:Uncharacterized protein n=1 Tax=Cystoisospora suis TaxID=483139 RepID=A0A2C6KSD6_9APIC|nr:hypothetical protein CSUI_006764 [Cystoisospora suis]